MTSSQANRGLLASMLFTFVEASLLLGQAPLNSTELARRVSPAVVTITGRTLKGELTASGFIVNPSGTIVTSFHVICDLQSAKVQIISGDVYDLVSLRAADERRDLAVIQVPGFDLPTVELGNSNEVQVGDPVLLIGSPRGLQGSVTTGVISAVRDLNEGFKVFQTDAASNPGNSGGPMVNGKGQAIGVLGFKLKSSEGLNFAIPINYVRGHLNNLGSPVPLSKLQSGGSEPAKTLKTKSVSRLGQVKAIYVAHFSDGEGAAVLREKVVNRLLQSGRFQVANTPEEADAVFVGTGAWDSGRVDTFVARLVTGESTILWSGEAIGTEGRSASASTNVAEKLVRDLLKTLSQESRSKR